MTKNDLYFNVAEAIFRLRFPDIDDARPYLPSYRPFHLPSPTEEEKRNLMFTLTVAEGIVPFEGTGKEYGVFDCGGANHSVFALDEGGYRLLIHTVEGERACAVETTADFRECRVSAYGDDDIRRYGIGNAIMIAFAFAGAYHHIVLMHSSVTMVGENGYLFLGKSGTGKSTHSALWRSCFEDADLLNDDNPAVRIHEDGNAYVYGTPWSGKTPCYRSLRRRAAAIVKLEQWPENIIRPLPTLEAFATILASCSTMIWDKPSYNHILTTTTQMTKLIPVYHLQCLPDNDAARLSRKTIAGK